MVRNNRSAHVRANANRLLKAALLTDPPVPIEKLVGDQGLAITEGKIPKGWGYFDAGAWAVRLSSELFRETPRNQNRRRFTLAHELGHCVLDHGEQSCWNLAALPEPMELDELDDLPDFEQEAHHFAREILLPRSWFLRDWKRNPDPARWERVYEVSRETLFIVLGERRLLMAGRTRR
jgi:Zn-dependent peptidase ImmA (M78 family)